MTEPKVKLSVIAKSLNRLYTDTLTVFRNQDVTDPETKRTTQQLVPVDGLSDIECRVSFDNGVDYGGNDNKGANLADYDVTIFTNIEHKIEKGDRIIAKRLADDGKITLDEIEGDCGFPNRYTSHQQIKLNRNLRG